MKHVFSGNTKRRRSIGLFHHTFRCALVCAILCSVGMTSIVIFYNRRLIWPYTDNNPVIVEPLEEEPVPITESVEMDIQAVVHQIKESMHDHSCVCLSDLAHANCGGKKVFANVSTPLLSLPLTALPAQPSCSCGVRYIQYRVLPVGVELLNETVIHPLMLGGPAQQCCNGPKSGQPSHASLNPPHDQRAQTADDRAGDAAEPPRRVPLLDVETTTAPAAAAAAEEACSRSALMCRSSLRKRYVLANLTIGKRYMMRLSYLGIPMMTFMIRNMHLPLCDVVQGLRTEMAHGRVSDSIDVHSLFDKQYTAAIDECDAGSVDHAATFRPLDSNLHFVSTDYTVPNAFRRGDVHVELSDVKGFTGYTRVNGSPDQSMVAVIEIEPRMRAVARNHSDFPMIFYNIELVPVIWGMVPAVVVPYLIVIGTCLVVAVQLYLRVDFGRLLVG